MKSLSKDRASLRIWADRANSEEQRNQSLAWERNAIDFANKMAEKYNVSNETAAEVIAALYKKS